MIKRTSLLTTLLLASGMTFAAGTFDSSDRNGDGMLSENEYNSYVSDNYIYSAWDQDDDRRLNEDEFDASVFDADFNDWDTDRDGYLNDYELNNATFDYYDEDEDGHWDGDEWDDAGDDGWFDI